MKSARKPYPQTPKNRPKNINALEKDALQVFCRLRPTNQEVCMRVLSSSVVCVFPPDNANNYNYRGVSKESQFMFKEVFIPDTTQQQVFETVAQPLVEGLIQGKNGLLFTYGVTGSGKTYTMTGDSKSAGIMPRCIQTLFKTIGDYQAEKYVFKPDRLNGFEMQTDADAQSDRSDDARSKRRAPPLVKSSSESSLASLSGSEIYSLKGLDTSNVYSVFITFVEIYNNGVFDLLDENQKSLQNKIIREDYMHNMFVHGVTEVEVKSPSEAMTLFCRGQKRKRMAYTDLNAESSRSHSIFTIRLVQTSANCDENQQITISQLSLVDLAGSERSSRTKNTGARLKEASNINNSLLNLRICLEILRENYVTGGTRLVPYRDNKLTHLFKMYFEGGGYVRMIVCVNPSSLDYEESLQVMKFAELSQDVQIAKPTPMKIDVEVTPRVKPTDIETPKNGRYALPPTSAARSATVITDRRRCRQIMPPPSKPDPICLESDKDVDYGLVYSLNELPRVKIASFGDYELLKELRHALEQRMTKRNKLLEDLRTRQSHFRKLCNEYDVYKLSSAAEIESLKVASNQYLERIDTLENRLVDTEKERDELHTAIERKNEQIYAQQIEINEKELIVSQTVLEKEKQKKKYDTKLINHQEKLHQDFEQKLREQRENLRQRMKDKESKIRQVRKIVLDEANSTASSELDLLALKGTPSDKHRVLTELDLNAVNSPRTAPASNQQQHQYMPKMWSGNTPVRRRSRSVGPCERWLEHRSGLATDLGTLLQPQMKKTKTLTKLTTPNDIVKSVSKYCLISQEPDTDGEIETRVVKGDVIQTTGGGAQVIFNDVEVLRQDSPTRPRKRSIPPNSSELTARCSIGIEGHNTSKRSKS
ncbi:kinesin-like protein KIF23 [Chrysoperla carnea]|uniref:kinesin-like protein KIF23 n=1 Tax=Chrysoperla carnea TaxID=189513 RepID=UPI001D08FC1D|nr:kinesin-like protein KIF23 [Chrysoperla carnea]